MRLSDFYKSIGLRGIMENKRKMNKILRLASFSPDFCFERKIDKKGRVFFDRYKFLGTGFGVFVHGFRRMRINKEGKKVEKHVVNDWGVFAQGYHDNAVDHAFVDMDYDQMTYCFAEDLYSGNAIEFRINNTLEVMDRFAHMPNQNAVIDFEKNISKVNVAMLMIFGTVLLPVLKDEEHQQARAQEEAMHRELLNRVRQGDAWAEESLQKMVTEQEEDLRERLNHEDLLSVFEGYFLNLIEQSGIFSILAEILAVEELTNEASLERIYRISVSVTDIRLTLYISENDITGMPLAGMRLMGVGMLQGAVLLN